MTKKDKTVGKTTMKYNIEQFKDYLIVRQMESLQNKKCDDEVALSGLIALNEFEKECNNGK